MNEQYEEKNIRFARQHVIAAFAAFLVSMILHVLLVFFVMSLPFAIAALVNKQIKTHKEKPITVVSVQRDPVGSGTAPSGDDRQPGKSEAKEIDMVKAVNDLSVPVDRAVTQPKPVDVTDFRGEAAALTEAPDAPKPTAWEARQEILVIDRTKAVGPDYPLDRRVIPVIERVSSAPDITYPVDRDEIGKRVGGKASIPQLANGAGGVPGGKGFGGPYMPKDKNKPDELPGKDALLKEQITDKLAIEKLLKIQVSKYEPFLMDRAHLYVKIEVSRIGEEELPVIPKDVLIVQDSSNSMAEQRMYFCRDGLNRCLKLLGPKDRFNIIRFRESQVRCFPSWVENTRENVMAAASFVADTRSGANTDIYGSLTSFLGEKREVGRPMAILLVSDGVPTAGLVNSSEIIGQFSAKNNGGISVFTFGTIKISNDYLLDMVGYCNRGASFAVKTGRWDIPESMESFFGSFRRPVLSDISMNLPGDEKGELYPGLMSNLYLDRPMVLYGRFPRDQNKIVFQAVGKGKETQCDMVFDVDLDNVAKGNDSIRNEWAKQKIYHLIGKHARTRDKIVLDAITETSKEYGVDIPYKKQL